VLILYPLTKKNMIKGIEKEAPHEAPGHEHEYPSLPVHSGASRPLQAI
jgi:hypothetical protein